MTPNLERIPLKLAGNPQPVLSDEDVMEMIQAQNCDGLDQLQRRYTKLLKAMSMKVLHNDSDCDDLVQEVFLEIWNRASSYSPLKGKPLSWIVTLACRRSIDRLRKRDVYCRMED